MMSPSPDHRWSGWPGAWCLDCGIEDQNEIALTELNKCDAAGHAMSEMGTCLVNHNPPCLEPGSNRCNPYARPDVFKT
jgi:hypothetical protein